MRIVERMKLVSLSFFGAKDVKPVFLVFLGDLLLGSSFWYLLFLRSWEERVRSVIDFACSFLSWILTSSSQIYMDFILKRLSNVLSKLLEMLKLKVKLN